WLRPDEAYEAALGRYVSGIAGDPDLQAGIASFVAPLVGPGRTVSLAQKLLQLTAPGVPDLYQGTELWDLSLVDPDNRHPVDHAHHHRLLAELEAGPPAGEVMARTDEGLPKLWLVHQALATRRLRPEAFGPGPAGSYRPLEVQGPASLHAVAFSRGEQVVA